MTDTAEERSSRIPVIRLWGVLLVPLQGDVTDRQVSELVNTVLNAIRTSGTNAVIVDLSGLWMVDSHLCAAFAGLAASARYMGARTVLCGLGPDIAMTLESMGIELRGVETMLTLEHALAAVGLRPAGLRSSHDKNASSRKLEDEMLARNPAETASSETARR